MERNLTIPRRLAATDDRRLTTISELVDTERSYVRDLGALCELKHALIQNQLLNLDHVQNLLSNIQQIYNLHQRFLLDVQQVESLSNREEKPSRIACLFVKYEHSFRVYMTYLANTCMYDRKSFVRDHLTKIQATGHPITQDFFTLDRYLIMPLSRFVKYHVLMKDILRHTVNPEELNLIQDGISASERIQRRGMSAMKTALLQVAKARLPPRVESWKNLEQVDLGTLLLHGYFHAEVVDQSRPRKVTSTPVSVNKIILLDYSPTIQYEIYLFENWLLFFKPQIDSRGRERRDISDDEIARSNLVLAGRLLMGSITQIAQIAREPSSLTAPTILRGE